MQLFLLFFKKNVAYMKIKFIIVIGGVKMEKENISTRMDVIMNKIKNLRENLGYSFQDLSEITGISKSTLQRYETGNIKNIPIL